ncbi:MAG TPA: hypothetical protein VLG76_00140 [Rhabdochlamydiaceae bacterium]|nr:hypothetical protein [Rhabdochlamydiaceae bacterium]
MQIIDAVKGSGYGLFLAYNLFNLNTSRREWTDAVSLSETEDKILALKKKTILAGISSVSWFSYVLAWAHDVHWISLGRFLPILGPIGLTASTILFSAESKAIFQQLQSETKKEERNKAVLHLITNSLVITHYVLTLLAFGIKAAVIVSASQWFLYFSIISLIVQASYDSFLKKRAQLELEERERLDLELEEEKQRIRARFQVQQAT